METSDWALVISILSLGVALGSLAWNVWSKFIYPKPKLRVVASVILIIEQGSRGDPPKLIRVSATNHGPISIKLTGPTVTARKGWLKTTLGIPKPLVAPFASDQVDPFAGFPATIAVGETKEIYFPYAADSLFRRGVIKIGVADSFDRVHWAPRRHVTAIKRSLRRDFPLAWSREQLREVAFR